MGQAEDPHGSGDAPAERPAVTPLPESPPSVPERPGSARPAARPARRSANALTLAGGVALFASLFLPWSHQFSQHFLILFGNTSQLQGVPHDPTAWQVYSILDVLMAALALALAVLTLLDAGGRGRAIAAGAAAIALAFVLHALAVPPTNGANVYDPGLRRYVLSGAQSGPGEVVALVGLVLALIGLGWGAVRRG